jgi:antirestriction protein ArdC
MENFNVSTKALYSVSNQGHLEEHKENFDLTANEWAGFHQWKTIGRKVKKGAKGCKIFMVCEKKVDNKNGKTDEKKKVLKALYVFNIEHTEEV